MSEMTKDDWLDKLKKVRRRSIRNGCETRIDIPAGDATPFVQAWAELHHISEREAVDWLQARGVQVEVRELQ
jgi:hypothetical protein